MSCFRSCCMNCCCCCRPVCCMPTPTVIMLGGQVTGVGGAVANVPITYTVNGTALMTATDSNGRYSIVAPFGSMVVITPQPGLGVTVTPAAYTERACVDRADLNFTLSPLV